MPSILTIPASLQNKIQVSSSRVFLRNPRMEKKKVIVESAQEFKQAMNQVILNNLYIRMNE